MTAFKPEVGMGATICYHSDRAAATIIKVSKSGKSFTIQEDTAVRVDKNGMSDDQEYEYTPNPNGSTYKVTHRKDGTYRLMGDSTRVSVGVRRSFYDFSF